MKKNNFLMLGCILIASIFIVSCSSNNIETNETLITRDYLSEPKLSGMGSDYQIINIKKGKYNLSLYAKEFSKGKFVKEENLYSTTLDLNKKINEFKLSVHQQDKDIKILAKDSEWYNVTLDFFDKDISGIALFEIETENKVEINKELPILGYIIGDEVKEIESSNIDEIFNHNSEGEIMIYMKISSVK